MLKRKTARRDGSTHLVMSPLAFMQRPAAAPDPFGVRCANHGVLAPDAKLRARAQLMAVRTR